MTNALRLLAVTLSAAVVAVAAASASPPATRSAPPSRAVDAEADAATRVAKSLYAFHMAHDMGFAPETLALRARWLTPELLALAKTYFARPSPDDEAPVIDGDPFTNAQDTPTRFTVGTATVTSAEAEVELGFYWDDGAKTTATVILRKIGGAWLVDDITYPEGSSFRQLLTAPPD